MSREQSASTRLEYELALLESASTKMKGELAFVKLESTKLQQELQLTHAMSIDLKHQLEKVNFLFSLVTNSQMHGSAGSFCLICSNLYYFVS